MNNDLMNSSKSSSNKNKSNLAVKETFHGYIETTRDSLLLFEACKRGIIPRISRRLQDKERYLIRSGSVFCFDEKESGIKRWTDGLVWSPSRISGNFLIYRELDDKKLARSSSTDYGAAAANIDENDYDGMINSRSRSGSLGSCVSLSSASGYVGAPDLLRRQREKALVGTLKTSYKFKTNGLIKKSISIAVNGIQQHIISYYTKEDVLSCRLKTPSSVLQLSSLEVSPGLCLRQNFRIPIFLNEEASSSVADDRFMEDYQQQKGNKNKRKYSDFAAPLDYDVGSSPTSFTSTMSSNSNADFLAPLVDTQYFSIMKATDDSYLPVTQTNSGLYLASALSSSSCQLSSVPVTLLPLGVFDDLNKREGPSLNSNNAVYGVFDTHKNNGMLVSGKPRLSQTQFNNSRATQIAEHERQEAMVTNLMENSFISMEHKAEKAHNLNPSIINSNNNNGNAPITENFSNTKNITSTKSFSNANINKRRIIPSSNNSSSMSMNLLNIASASAVNNHFVPSRGGYYSSPYYDDDQGQNPHQHLFSSSSFHAINHAAMPNRTEVTANAFMLDMNILLGTGWNEFELQM